MKLKDDYIIYNPSKEEVIAVATGAEAEKFNGLLRGNDTAATILEYLKKQTTEDEIVKNLLEEYETTEEEIRIGLTEVLETLRSIDALEE